jgi:hypothetical protein
VGRNSSHYLPCVIALPLGCDQDARIEDYSHAEGSNDSR